MLPSTIVRRADNRENDSSRLEGKGSTSSLSSLLAQALEVPDLDHQLSRDSELLPAAHTVDVSSFSPRSGTFSPMHHPYGSFFGVDQDSERDHSNPLSEPPVAPDSFLPLHSDFTIPTSNVKLNNISSPPPEITPSSKEHQRRSVFGKGVGKRYVKRIPKPDAAIRPSTPPQAQQSSKTFVPFVSFEAATPPPLSVQTTQNYLQFVSSSVP